MRHNIWKKRQLAHLNTLDPLLKHQVSHSLSTELGIARASIESYCRERLLHDAFNVLLKSNITLYYRPGFCGKWISGADYVACSSDQPPYYTWFTHVDPNIIQITQYSQYDIDKFVQASWCRHTLLKRQQKKITSTTSPIKTAYALNYQGRPSYLMFTADFSHQEIAKMHHEAYAQLA
jgi:hypothetical protein